MSFEGFKVYIPTTGDATLTLTKNGLGISKTTVVKLNRCEYVKILIDYQGRRMAIVETNEGDPAKVDFARNGKIVGLRWNSKDLVSTLCQMNHWSVADGERYTIPGEYSAEDSAMIFDFNQATKS